jgi:hypothetical protein
MAPQSASAALSKRLPETLRDAAAGADSSLLLRAAMSADSVIQRQSSLAANSDIDGEDDAKKATDAVEEAVSQATKEADASEAEVDSRATLWTQTAPVQIQL